MVYRHVSPSRHAIEFTTENALHWVAREVIITELNIIYSFEDLDQLERFICYCLRYIIK